MDLFVIKHTRLNICPFPNCEKYAIFGISNIKTQLYCKTHKTIEMFNVKQKKCLDCLKTPNFNFKEFSKGIYCNDHKKLEMIDVENKHCLDCSKQPRFNFIGELNGIYCSDHKKLEMINVIDKRCLDCDKLPTFGNIGTKERIYCFDHKLSGMINTVDKTCLDCLKIPSFNYKGNPAIYCFDHKKIEMINVKNRVCLDCTKTPIFNFKNQFQGIYCSDHKKIDMVDVNHKLCACNKRPNYNFIGYSPICCIKCKEPNMIIHPIKRCECKKLATKINDSTFYCDAHAIENAIDIHEICSICFNKTEIDKQICDICSIKITLPIKQHLKELQILNHLKNNEIEIYLYDKPVGESKRRPDFIIKYDNNNVIIIECDEFQHKKAAYPPECEIIRIKQIYFDMFSKNALNIHDIEIKMHQIDEIDIKTSEIKILFIRYNPDNYISDYQYTTKQRLNYLEKYIKDFNFNKITSGLYIKYLFYDHFDLTESQYALQSIDPYYRN
jgi:hypothetical protein